MRAAGAVRRLGRVIASVMVSPSSWSPVSTVYHRSTPWSVHRLMGRAGRSDAAIRHLAAIRELAAALAPLLAAARDFVAAGPSLEELERAALLEATRPEIDASTRLLVAGVLNEFRGLERAGATLDGVSASSEEKPPTGLIA